MQEGEHVENYPTSVPISSFTHCTYVTYTGASYLQKGSGTKKTVPYILVDKTEETTRKYKNIIPG